MASSTPHKALVTGASRGIGAAIAQALRERGLEVVTPTRAEMDLLDPASVRRYLSSPAVQGVDVLVNNAGINVLNGVNQLSPQDWQTMVRLDLTAPLELIQGLGPQMQARKWGRILNISSIFSLVTKERRGAYSMTKAALNALTRSAAVEYGAFGVLVNALAPGYVDTELTRQNNTPEQMNAILQKIPLRRMAQPAELAKAAAFLVSEENSYMTGQVIVIDGGFTCE